MLHSLVSGSGTSRREQASVLVKHFLDSGHDDLMAESLTRAALVLEDESKEEWFFDHLATAEAIGQYNARESVKSFMGLSDHDFEDTEQLYRFSQIMIPHRMIELFCDDLPGLCRILIEILKAPIDDFMSDYHQRKSPKNSSNNRK